MTVPTGTVARGGIGTKTAGFAPASRRAAVWNWRPACLTFICLLVCPMSRAAATYLNGHINDVTFVADEVLVRMDTGVPDNCAGTLDSWIRIPPVNKPMVAFIVGLWMRGDLSSTPITIYTDATNGSYCSANQIDPAD